MEYAKFLNEYSIDTVIPSKYKKDGRLYVGDLSIFPEIMAEMGYLEVDRSGEIEPEPVEGYHSEERFAIVDGRIVATLVLVEDPAPEPLNREISKRRLMNNLKALNLWTTVKSIMEQNDYLEDWEAATTLEEQDPLLQGAIAIVKQAAGLTDAEINNLIENSVAY